MRKIVQTRFAELLARKERLEQRRISRRKIAEETGMSLNSVQNWATNHVESFYAAQIIAFCEYFDCEPGELLVIEEFPNTPEIKTPLIAAFAQ